MVNNSNPKLTYYDNYKEVYRRPEGYFDSLVNEIIGVLGNKDVAILDIGCGFGDFLGSFEKNLKGKGKYFGLTIAEHEYNFIKEKINFIDVQLGKQQDLQSIFPNKKFDIIINSHTLSYVTQDIQREVIIEMKKSLNKDGMIVLGLIDDWIKLDSHIKQSGAGYVQFYYSPLIFLDLNGLKLIYSSVNNKNSYRIQFWKNEKGGNIKGIYLSLFYILRNNVLLVNNLKKIIKKIYEVATKS
jgi:SAM-dependent methyltransferase